MRPEVLKAGYKHLPQFLSIVRKYNPDGKIRSVQSDRLELTSQADTPVFTHADITY
jgi:decaprenylphospho-beta-D-ribofuranose 2-oxidase